MSRFKQIINKENDMEDFNVEEFFRKINVNDLIVGFFLVFVSISLMAVCLLAHSMTKSYALEMRRLECAPYAEMK